MTSRGFFSRVAGRAAREWADFRAIRAGLFKHHAGRLSGRPEVSVNLRRVGSITLRPANSDLATIRQIFHDEEYRPPIPQVEQALKSACDAILANDKTPVIVDAGANIGAATLWLRQRYPLAHIVALEPDPVSFSLLKRNVGTDPAVTAIEAAVGAKPGHVHLFTIGDSWATQSERSDNGTRIVTVPEAFAEVPNGKPFIVKVDIEGFESDLFSDNLSWLDEVSAVFVEPHDWRFPGQHTSRSFQQAMGTRDFELFIVGGNLLYVRI